MMGQEYLQESDPSLEPPDVPGERRYRTSRYFQQDRLRCSEAAADLREMKNLMIAVETTWNIRGIGRSAVLQRVTVPVRQ
jgi:hypothetical protein